MLVPRAALFNFPSILLVTELVMKWRNAENEREERMLLALSLERCQM